MFASVFLPLVFYAVLALCLFFLRKCLISNELRNAVFRFLKDGVLSCKRHPFVL